MPTVRRLADSCLTISTDQGVTLFDPGFFSFDSGEVDLSRLGEVNTVLITHEHGDHVKPEFVRWLLDRGQDVTVHSNQAVADLLARNGIEARTDDPVGVTSEDVKHGIIPNGESPPNRSFTVSGVFTHPGDSQELTTSGPVLALPLMAPWTSTTAAVEFARRLAPGQVIPIHDFYLSPAGREFLVGVAARVLAASGIEVIPLDWGQSASI